MKTLEEKAQVYADSVADNTSEVWNFIDEVYTELRKAYIAGANEAISMQWRNPKDELPKDGQLVLIREYHRSAKNGRFVNHIREFMFFEQYGFKLEERKNAHLDYRITHWMPIPGLPNNKEE